MGYLHANSQNYKEIKTKEPPMRWEVLDNKKEVTLE
jgi:hypothetical protein